MEDLKEWIANSISITQKSLESYRSNFEHELKIRKEVAKSFDPVYFEVTPETVEGSYKIMGQNPDDPDSCYIGNVTFEYDDGTWLATWEISGFIHYGYGMLVSATILVFNFSYVDEEEEPHTGLVSYNFISDTIARGEWMEEGYSEKGIEELRKIDIDENDFNDMHDANFGFSLN